MDPSQSIWSCKELISPLIFIASCLNDHKLFLDKETETSVELYRKNGLHVVEYDDMDGDEDEMIYRMLDDDELDPVGVGFTLEEAILFAENYAFAHNMEYN